MEVRMEVADTEAGMYLLDDATIEYLLEKHNGSVRLASLDAARIILFQLSMSGNDQVGIFSIRGSADAYREALKLYIKDPTLNGALSNIRASISGATTPIISPTQSPTTNGFCGCSTGF